MSGTQAPVTITEIPLGDPRIKQFVDFHWKHYKGNPYWVPQLNADLLGNKLLGMTGLLMPEHPYHGYSKATHFMAHRDGTPVGRISAVVNERFNEFYDVKHANFGFFEVIEDYDVAVALLDAARDWGRAQGMTVLRGPGEYSNATVERQGCLIEGFDQDVYLDHTYNPPYYQEFFERYGFTKAMDYVAHMIDLKAPIDPRVGRLAAAVRERGHLTTRPAELSRLNDEVRLIVEIFNQAWAKNWGFLPLQEWEADTIAESVKPLIDPGLVRFAYYEGKPIAVLGAFPDPNYALRPRWKWYGDSDYTRIARLFLTRRKIPRIRLIFFGIVPGYRRLGADALLYEEVHQWASTHGYGDCDVSLLLEVNELIISAAESMGGKKYKTWRIFDLPL